MAQYQLRMITLAGYNHSTAVAVNPASAVAGYLWNDETDFRQPWVWRRGSVRQLSVPPDVSRVCVTGINVQGQVVGYGRKEGYYVGVLWRGPEQVVWDRTCDNTSIVFAAINDQGQVVGAETISGQRTENRCFVRDQNDTFFLDDLSPSAINTNGTICGTFYDGSFVNWSNAVVCQPGKPLRHLPLPEGFDFGYGHAINVKEQVVGAVEVDDEYRAVLWTEDQARIIVPTYSTARGLNDAGHVVGRMREQDGTFAAFRWQQGQLTRLRDTLPPDTDCKLVCARSINAVGVIAGSATVGPEEVGFVLSPQAK